MKKTYFLTATFLLIASLATVAGQEVILGDDGQKIILNPDGTWELFPGAASGQGNILLDTSGTAFSSNKKAWEQALVSEKQMALRLIKKRLATAELEGEIARLEVQQGVSEQAVFDLYNQLRHSKTNTAALADSLEFAKGRSKLLENTLSLPGSLREKAISSWELKNLAQIEKGKLDDGTIETIASTSPERFDPSIEENFDLLKNPPTRNCEHLLLIEDTVSGKKRRDLKPEILFAFTDPGLEAQFLKSDLVTGRAYLTTLSAGIRVLNLEIAVASKQAPKLFGGFKKGEFIRFVDVGGNNILLINNQSDGGFWDEIRQAHVYRCQYPIGLQESKLLGGAELDKVLVRWSKVQEEYEIFDVDLLARQFRCLEEG